MQHRADVSIEPVRLTQVPSDDPLHDRQKHIVDYIFEMIDSSEMAAKIGADRIHENGIQIVDSRRIMLTNTKNQARPVWVTDPLPVALRLPRN